MDRNLKITSADMLANVLKEKGKEEVKVLSKEEQMQADHVCMATQGIKIVNSTNLDPFIKKVMTLRMLGPIITGHEKTHMSIAIELGASVDDVINAEAFGIQVIEDLLQKVSVPEFVNQYNRDETVKKAVSTMGKSMQMDVQEERRRNV